MEKRVFYKKAGFVYRHRFALFLFLFTVFYHILIVNRLAPWRLNELTYSLYCVDFSYGFASKILPGAVFNFLLGSHASEQTANIYAVVLIVLFFAGLALMLERFLWRMPLENRRSALFLLLFFLSGAYTFSIFTKWLGMLDTSWLFLSLFFFVCLENKRLHFLIPLLYALALMIHFSAVVFYLTFFSIVLLYRISITEEKRERCILWFVFMASLSVTAIVFLLFLLNESHMVCPIEEFHEKLKEHGTEYFFYHDYAFFRIWGGESFIPDGVNEMQPSLLKFAYLFYYQIKLCYQLLGSNTTGGILSVAVGLLILSPFLVLFFQFHLFRLHQKGNALKRFSTFLMLVQFPFVFVLGLLFAISVDMTRYLTHGFLVMFACVLTVLYHEEDIRLLFFERMRSLEKKLPIKIYCFAYGIITLLPSL